MFFSDRPETPVGRIELAGHLRDTWRTFDLPMRVLNCYALIFVLDGGGRFKDGLGADLEVQEGDLIVLFPGVPYAYGPKPGKKWSELYAHFDGPAFDLWRDAGLLDPRKPVVHQQRAHYWRTELENLLMNGLDGGNGAQVIQVSQLLTILMQMFLTGVVLDKESELPRWLQDAITRLNPGVESHSVAAIAASAGMPYHTFLRRFTKETGMSPIEYRSRRQMEAAKSLLEHTNDTISQIAIALQFTDEFHFSNRFKAVVGQRPSEYRKLARLGTPSPEPPISPN